VDLATLMSAYCDGDVRAFRELYGAVAPRLLAYVRGFTRDGAVAEDLLQQTFMKLHAARASYVRGADPLPWLYAIAHRTSLDELRRRSRARVRAVDEVPEVAVGHDGVTDDARVDEPVHIASPADLSAAVASLPETYRTAFVLTKWEGLSCASAAAALGTTTGAVKLRVHRAYAMLREILARTSESPAPRRDRHDEGAKNGADERRARVRDGDVKRRADRAVHVEHEAGERAVGGADGDTQPARMHWERGTS
jgi:RNA polymerase sigma-70 factor (ECF subfamily)